MMKEQKENNNSMPDEQGLQVDLNTDESQIGTTHLTDPLENEPEILKLKEEIQELKDKYLRQVAEFDNYRKRSAREKVELIQTAGKDIITDMLDILDDIKRAQQQMVVNDDMAGMKEGVHLIFNKFSNNLIAKGVKPMDTLHQPFNPDIHEAITEIPAPSEDLKGKVVDVLQEGYYLNDKIIRFAKVIVGK